MGRKEIVINIIGGVAGGGAFVFFVGKYLADKSLAYYKKEYEKNLQDYNLFSQKRNEIYAEVYKLLREGYGILPNFRGRINTKTLENKEDRKQWFYDHCELKIRDFRNYLTLNELYIDQTITEKLGKVYDDLWKLQNMCGGRYINHMIDENEGDLRKNIENQIDGHQVLLHIDGYIKEKGKLVYHINNI